MFLTRYQLEKKISSILGFRLGIVPKAKYVMVSVVHYTVALYPILLKADASKKKYKHVFIYYLLGQQKSRLVELERCFEEAIGLHHGLCWLCEVFLQIFSSVFWYYCNTELQKRWTREQYSDDLCTQMQALTTPCYCQKGNNAIHSKDYYLIITQKFGIQNGESCRSIMPGITALPMGAVT